MGNYTIYFDDRGLLNSIVAKHNAVTAADVKNAANKFLPWLRAVVTTLPQSPAASSVGRQGAVKRIFPALTAAVLLLATTVLAQQDQGTSPKAVQHLNRAPVNREILQIKPPRPIETKLPNGLTVLLLERHQVPM